MGSRGVLSDDTVQSALVLQALLSTNDVDSFQRDFGRRLRLWFWSIPPGIGLSTIKACLRLTLGVPASRSGVHSAGNGAAMRCAVLGAALCEDPLQRVAFVEACARVTHTHPLGVQGAQIIALAAALSATGREEDFDSAVRELAPNWPLNEPCPSRGPSGYVVHSVNAALRVWRSARTFDEAIEDAVQMGGDTDTVAAMVGGIKGASPAFASALEAYRYVGWPQPSEISDLGPRTPWARLITTHLMALPYILAFGFRRLLPPY